jgi:transposase
MIPTFTWSAEPDKIIAAVEHGHQRPTMRFVALKSTERLDLQSVHRVRSRLVRQRT